MEDHLRIAVYLWHSFNWPGSDVFGTGTFDRPWFAPTADPLAAARAKLDAAFEFIAKLGVPFFCFHDRDIAPEGRSFAESEANLEAMVDQAESHMPRTGARLVWGTANQFSHPRYAAGAATNPDPEVFAYAAAQVKAVLEATHRLNGANYVLWGGREGSETLLNTHLAHEEAQLARFLGMVPSKSTISALAAPCSSSPSPRSQPSTSATTTAPLSTAFSLATTSTLNIE
jgi:xylose isomerase